VPATKHVRDHESTYSAAAVELVVGLEYEAIVLNSEIHDGSESVAGAGVSDWKKLVRREAPVWRNSDR
jgi:hypothetical protein